MSKVLFPSLSGKTFIRTANFRVRVLRNCERCFHPFQGRPSFGPGSVFAFNDLIKIRFHPFQGRPSFGLGLIPEKGPISQIVSIPFREDLHSDVEFVIDPHGKTYPVFPSLSGKTFIRTNIACSVGDRKANESFHPFQGRPSFGLSSKKADFRIRVLRFPSLSGKTFIRTSRTGTQNNKRNRRVSIPFREDLHSDSFS